VARCPIDPDDLFFADLDRLGDDVDLRPSMLYAHTKNMDVMLAYELARRLRDTCITVNAAHPGIIGQTGLADESPGLRQAIQKRYALDRSTLPPPDAGADTPAWLATSPDVENVTGRFFVERQPVETAQHTTDVGRCSRLRETTARLLGMPAD
jgi:NAD(P)-dependent dehydrogenase (short-subunit alcohol dehydrogenase family)